MSNTMATHFVVCRLENRAIHGEGVSREDIRYELRKAGHTSITDELVEEIFEWLIQLD